MALVSVLHVHLINCVSCTPAPNSQHLPLLLRKSQSVPPAVCWELQSVSTGNVHVSLSTFGSSQITLPSSEPLTVSLLSLCKYMYPIQSNMSVYAVQHYRCVVLCFVNIHQKGRFWAASLASGSSMPNEDTSLQTFQIQVERALPVGLIQLPCRCAKRIRLALANSFIWAICPNRQRVVGTWQRRKVEVVELFDVLHHFWLCNASKYLRSFEGTTDPTLGSLVAKALDLQLTGCEFNSRPRRFRVTTLGKLFRPTCLSRSQWFSDGMIDCSVRGCGQLCLSRQPLRCTAFMRSYQQDSWW